MVVSGCWFDSSMRWCWMSWRIVVPVPALAGVWRRVPPGPMMFEPVLWRWLRCLLCILRGVLGVGVRMVLHSLALTWPGSVAPP